MMTRQARKLHPQAMSRPAVFRSYALNSPEARARLIILALLADGEINEYELMTLNQPEVLKTLGISREGFVRVLQDFCADMSAIPRQGDSFPVSAEQLALLFGEVSDKADQRALMQLIVSLIQSDGEISREEMQYWRKAGKAWGYPLAEW